MIKDFFDTLFLILTEDSTGTILDNVIKVVGMITAMFTLIPYANSIRQRNHDADFSYLAQLRVNLLYVYKTLSEYRTDMIYSILVDGGRKPEPDRVEIIHHMRNELAAKSHEILRYLKETENQFPAGRGWSDCLTKLLDLLFICEKLSTENEFHHWEESVSEIQRCKDYDDYLENLNAMIGLIVKRQKKIERQTFFPWERIKR